MRLKRLPARCRLAKLAFGGTLLLFAGSALMLEELLSRLMGRYGEEGGGLGLLISIPMSK